MIFAKIDVDLRDHERAIEAGVEAMGLWLWGLLYARGQETDGVLREGVVRGCPWAQGDAELVKLLAAKLVAAGLWEIADGGAWRVRNYSAKNETKAVIAERRDAERDRKARWREGRSHVVSRDVSHRDTSVRPAGDRAVGPGSPLAFVSDSVISSQESKVGANAVKGDLGSAFVEGIRAGRGGAPYSLPFGALRELVDVARDFGGGRTEQDLLDWMRAEAEAFARSDFYGGLAPTRFKAWLNEGRPKAKTNGAQRQRRDSNAGDPLA